jgi:hypothetical protein
METVDQLKELRVIEHEQMILEYIEQVPIMRVPSITHRGVVAQMMSEYNEKYFPKPEQKEE